MGQIPVTLRLKPATAAVWLDGKPRRDNPLKLRATKRLHRLEVRARGHVSQRRTVRADRSQVVRVELIHKGEGDDEPGIGSGPGEAAGTGKPAPPPKAETKKDDVFTDL